MIVQPPPRKAGGFVRPRLPTPTLAAPESAEAGADAARAAEEAFDYELAADLWLGAARAATAAEAPLVLADYAAFLVERLGQVELCAAWLDDPAFAPPAEWKSAPLRRLWALVGAAAAQVGHARAAEIDAALVVGGDGGALARTAGRWAATGDDDRALALLQAHAANLPPEGMALLARLRATRHAAAQTALQPLADAVAGKDVAQGRQWIARLAADWRDHPLYQSLCGKIEVLAALDADAALRARVESALDSGELQAAHSAAAQLAQSQHATEADKRWLGHVAGLVAQRDRDRLGARCRDPDRDLALAALAQWLTTHGARAPGPLPAADPNLPLWHAACEAHTADKATPLASRLPALAALADLRAAVAAHAEPAVLAGLLDRMPAAWTAAPTVKAARAAVQAQADRDRQAEEAAFAQLVRDHIDQGLWDDAGAVLQAWTAEKGAATGVLRGLRNELQAARQHAQRVAGLCESFERALAERAWFAARTALGELRHLLPADRLAPLQQAWSQQAGPQLTARGMPPGLQNLDPQKPFCAAVAADRLTLVQGDMWLSVVLPGMGLQPFALPSEVAVTHAGHARLAGVRAADGSMRTRLIGVSQAALVAIDHAAPDAPLAVAACPFAPALRGDDRLVGAAIDPAASSVLVLTAHSQRPGQTHLLQLDPETLEPVGHRRTAPTLASLTEIAGWPGQAIATTQVAARQRGAFALAVLDSKGNPIRSFDTQAISHDLDIWGVQRAFGWPQEDRVYASFTVVDPFNPDQASDAPSLLVLRGDRVQFCSHELRRRFFPTQRLTVDRAWTLDRTAGRLWFAALPLDGEGADALLLGVNAKTLRADEPIALPGVQRVLHIGAVSEGAVVVCRQHSGQFALLRVVVSAGAPQIAVHKLPI